MDATSNPLQRVENEQTKMGTSKGKEAKFRWLLGLSLAVHVTPVNKQERAQVKELAEAVQEGTHNSVKVAFVDQG